MIAYTGPYGVVTSDSEPGSDGEFYLFILPLLVNPVCRNVAVAFCDEGWAIDRMSYRWATVSREDHNGRRSGSATTPQIIAKAARMSPTRP